MFICIYSVRDDIDQISTNTLRYTMCCAPIVYMFVYILIGAHIVPLNKALTPDQRCPERLTFPET